MRLLPKRSSRSNKNETGGHHRRSWHVGTGNHGKGNSSSNGKHNSAKSWHFPRISRHSMHMHHSFHPRHEEDGDAGNKHAVELEFAGERKTFSYAAHAREDHAHAQASSSTTRAPSPPEGTRTEESNSQEDAEQQRNNKKKNDNVFRKFKRKSFRVFHAVEVFFFPGCQPLHGSVQHPKTPRVRGGVLLRGSLTADEHKAKALQVVQLAKTTYGEKGLRAIGFEYRLILCPEHGGGGQEKERGATNTNTNNPPSDKNADEEKEATIPEHESVEIADDGVQEVVKEDEDCSTTETTPKDVCVCRNCAHSLFHIESNTQIKSDNRKLFIADGDMYDAVAKLCQENAHQVMQEQFGMVWEELCPPDTKDDGAHPLKKNKHEPIRALVNPPEPEINLQRPTLLIVTGKGKVRAGIFSRQHLLVSGMEASTALPFIQEAKLRKINLVIIDPNCHGDAMGMTTFQKSMEKAFCHWEEEREKDGANEDKKCRDLYIVSHSASGSHLVRYLLEKSKHYVPHIRAIAFTDATHNVQWARHRKNQPLVDLLESPACIYFRCSDPNRDCNWAKHRAGEEVPTDIHWQHRFGKIRTCWAGTNEHSLTNWTSHDCIWDHFDRILEKGGG